MGKNDRIRRLVPIFENHRFYLPHTLMFIAADGKVHDFIHEFLTYEYETFPVCTHDDMLDCISRIVEPDLNVKWPKIETNPGQPEFANIGMGTSAEYANAGKKYDPLK